jgi:chaperonin GroEL
MSKLIIFDQECREKLKSGVDILANAVKVTLGPRGRNVAIEKSGDYPHVTKDGVTVARSIELSDRFENMGAQMVKEVAGRTAEHAGDGTTTATLLAQVIYTEGLKNVAAGANPIQIKRSLDLMTTQIVKYLQSIAQPINDNKDILNIATISANNDPIIGALIAEAFSKIGTYGVITIEDSLDSNTTLEVVPGMQFDKGYISSYFVNTDNQTCEMENPYILVCDYQITTMQDLIPLLEQLIKQSRPLLIIADTVEGDALSTLVINKVKNSLNVVAVKSPGYGERRKKELEDIAILCGASFISNTLGRTLRDTQLEDLGECERIIVSKDNTIIINGKGDLNAIESRIDSLKKEISKHSDYVKLTLENRLAKLAGGVAVLHVGSATEIEKKEKKDRIEDALHATRAAQLEGIIPGGGVGYLRALSVLDLNTIGGVILSKALKEPLRQILLNAGLEPSIVIQSVIESQQNMGFNVNSEKIEDMIISGIIDPLKVSRCALENAVSIAGMLLTTECLIVENE